MTNELQKSAFGKLKGRYNDLINKYDLSLRHLLSNMVNGNLTLFLHIVFHTKYSKELLQNIELTAGETCQNGILAPAKHKIQPLMCQCSYLSNF